MDDFYLAAGNRIRICREKLRLTREDLAGIVDISTKFLYEIETGKKGFSASTLVRISDGLAVSCEYILLGKTRDVDARIFNLETLSNVEYTFIASLLDMAKEVIQDISRSTDKK